ncbi:MAG TPA: SDR family oxidoreductase [Planctomycetaceae bacterium]|nr:SDR family oxidoreductase [Planctomycetaceae bacterium]
MPYYLLTGATGLLGNYLLRDLLRANVPVAVLVRPSRRQSARQRVELLLAKWDEEYGEALPRPVVLEGDITQEDLGLDANNLRWAAEHCGAIINNAASLTFHATSEAGEPYRSNITGTKNVLEFARSAGIREFHHVSTAYVAGLRSGRCLETELNVGQEFGNDYEKTKVTSEQLVREADFIEQPTVYRPAIIIGDSQTGYTTTYHGFYAALQLAHTLSQTLHRDDDTGLIAGQSVRLSLDGHETKNLVPVDWVSSAMTHIILHREWHGQTYHLTPKHPVTMRLIRDVLEHSIGFYGAQLCGSGFMPSDPTDVEALFHEHIRIYNSYWRMDPEFDRTNIERATAHIPCPEVDRTMLLRLSRVAIQGGFPTPSKKPLELEFDATQFLQSWLDQGEQLVVQNPRERQWALDVRGPGGGQWELVVRRGQLVAVEMGLHNESSTICRTDADTFAEIMQGRLTWQTAFATGAAQVIGDSAATREATSLLSQLADVPVPSETPQPQTV